MIDYTRREIIEMSVGSFLRLALALPTIVLKGQETQDKFLNWDAFIEQVAKAADSQFRRFWNQEAYVKQVSRLAEVLNFDDPRLESELRRSPNGFQHPCFWELEKRTAFQVTLISFETGDSIPVHDHPDMTGITMCVAGRLTVRNYDLLRGNPDLGSCLVRKVRDAVLQPRKTSLLTAKNSNIHELHSQSRCQIIDIFTPPYDLDRTSRAHWYVLEPEPNQPNVFRAATV